MTGLYNGLRDTKAAQLVGPVRRTQSVAFIIVAHKQFYLFACTMQLYHFNCKILFLCWLSRIFEINYQLLCNIGFELDIFLAKGSDFFILNFFQNYKFRNEKWSVVCTDAWHNRFA